MTSECSLTLVLGNYLLQDVHILRRHSLAPIDLREAYVQYYEGCTELPQQYSI